MNAAGFVSNFRWHEKFPDVDEAVQLARRKKVTKGEVLRFDARANSERSRRESCLEHASDFTEIPDAIIPAQKHSRILKGGFRGGGQHKKLLYSVMKTHGKASMPGILGGTVSMDDWLRNKELHVTLNHLAKIRVATEYAPVDSDRAGDNLDADCEEIQERMGASVKSGYADGGAVLKETSTSKSTMVMRGGHSLAGPGEVETGEGVRGKRFARARVDADGRSRPSRLADAGQAGFPTSNMYDRQLQNGRHHRKLKPNADGRGGLHAPHPPPLPPPTPLGALKAALQERGFQDAIDAFTFFDSDQKGSITRGDLQKGLLSLRIFKVTAKAVPFPRSGLDGIDR